jgi:MGT family glycosyltransferase
MKKIVFFNIPAHGHTNPTLGVVRELVARGHQVWYYSYESLRQPIEAAGAIFVSCDDADAQQKLTEKDGARLGKDLALSTRVLVDTTLALDGAVSRMLEKLHPDCIVADSMALWGKLFARKLQIPLVSSTTTFAFNQASAQTIKQSGGELLRMMLSLPAINRQLRRLRKRGYPVKSVLDIIGNDNETDTVVYTSPEFQPCSETFSGKYAFVGPSIRPVEEPVEKQREKLVYISMGTVDNDKLALYRNCVEALKDQPYQVMMSVGGQVDVAELGQLPSHISACPRVDQMAVLQQADVFLTHCGMNSVSESLYFGVPLVMLPGTPEQGAVAARAEQLGAGLRLEDTTPAGIVAALRKVLETPSYREHALEIGAGFRACPGAKGAAEKILQVCGE